MGDANGLCREAFAVVRSDEASRRRCRGEQATGRTGESKEYLVDGVTTKSLCDPNSICECCRLETPWGETVSDALSGDDGDPK